MTHSPHSQDRKAKLEIYLKSKLFSLSATVIKVGEMFFLRTIFKNTLTFFYVKVIRFAWLFWVSRAREKLILPHNELILCKIFLLGFMINNRIGSFSAS